MAEINDLEVVDGNNTARFPEGQAPSTVNDGARALEGIVARWHKDTNGSLTTTGTGSAYALTANQALTAYYNGLQMTAKAHVVSGVTPTLNVDGVSADTIVWSDGTALAAGDIPVNSVFSVIHDGATNWKLVNIPGFGDLGGNIARTDTTNTFTEDQTISTTGINDFTLRSGLSSGFPVEIKLEADNSTGSTVTYVNPTMAIKTNTAGSEDGRFDLNMLVGGSSQRIWRVESGMQIGNPTGGNIADAINTEAGCFKDNVEYDIGGWQTIVDRTLPAATLDELTGIDISEYDDLVFMTNGMSPDGNSYCFFQFGDATDYTTNVTAVGGCSDEAGVNYNTYAANTGVVIAGTMSSGSTIESVTLITRLSTAIAESMFGAGFDAWAVQTASMGASSSDRVNGAGFIATSKTIDRVRITLNSTNTFTGGRWAFMGKRG